MTAPPIDQAQERAEIAALVDALTAAGWPDGLAAERAAMEAEATPLAPDIAAISMHLAGRPAELLVGAGGGGAGTCLYLHGGGYVYGSLLSHRGLVGELARATDLRMIQLDYRLAPEHPFPAAIEDAVAAICALYDSGVGPQDLVLMGDSAGGGLALATLLALRAADRAMPRAAVVLSPWTDLSCSGDSYRSRAAMDPMIDHALATKLAGLYAGDADRRDPRLSPLNGDLSGLPPILIQVGERETLYSDAADFAARAQAAGSPVTIEEWPGMIHVWHQYYAQLAAGHRAIARIAAYLRDIDPAEGTPR